MSPPPIIFIHRGDSFYLSHTVAQARSSNPESRLILLGDRSNSFYLGVEHHRYEDYFDEAREFAKLFTYEYFPNYQYPWILFCHQKYFTLRDFVREQGIEKFLLIDSDVMIYERLEPYLQYYRDYRMTVSASTAEPAAAQAAFAVVNDSSAIGDLCQTYKKLYRESPEELQTSFGTDFFTEMLGLAILLRDPAKRIKNTFEPNSDFVINHNLLNDPRFEKEGEFAAIFWQDDGPMFRENSTGRLRKSPVIHFHGHAKKLMAGNLRTRQPLLRMEHAINRVVSAVAKYPMRTMNKVAGRPVFPGI